jgi:hypothetical protein
VVAADLGLVNDRTVCVVAHAELVDGSDRDGARRVVVDRLARWRGAKGRPVQLSEIEAWVEQSAREYNRAGVHADPWQSAGLLQRLRSRGVRAEEFVFSAQSVGRVAQSLHMALRNRLIWLPDDEDLLAELGRVRLREVSPGTVRLDHDSGQHDDQAVALGIAVSVLLDRPAVNSMERYLRSLADECPGCRQMSDRVAQQRVCPFCGWTDLAVQAERDGAAADGVPYSGGSVGRYWDVDRSGL